MVILYAILASSLPQRKLGLYIGLFNVSVVVPQLLIATVMGWIIKRFFPTKSPTLWPLLRACWHWWRWRCSGCRATPDGRC